MKPKSLMRTVPRARAFAAGVLEDMTQPSRIDWPQLIRDLETFGLGCRAIGVRVGRGRLWVVRLRNGVRPQPRFTDGCRLLRLWADATSKPMAKAPVK